MCVSVSVSVRVSVSVCVSVSASVSVSVCAVGVLSAAALVAAQSPVRCISYLRTCMFRYSLHFVSGDHGESDAL